MNQEMGLLFETAMDNVPGQNVLVCPLDWGLGHAARCVPIIKALEARGKNVLLAADGFPLEFLKQEFPHLEHISFPGFKVKYATDDNQMGAMFTQLPQFLKGIRQEHRAIKKICAQYQIDTVISDNRFGLWNRRVYSIYMTHQLVVKMPIKWHKLEKLVWFVHRLFINQYNTCWIPDFANHENLTGELTHKYKLPKKAQFIGILSRFSSTLEVSGHSPYETIALISGPEPHRSILENKLIKHLQKSLFPSLIVRGVPSQQTEEVNILNVKLLSHLDTPTLQSLIASTPTVMCRSGYSTLMDLVSLDKKAILIPTPGQTEQEYLAEHMKQLGFTVFSQDEI